MIDSESLKRIPINITALHCISEDVAMRLGVLPVSLDGEKLHIIIPPPDDTGDDGTLDDLRFMFGTNFSYELAPKDDLELCIERHYSALKSAIQNCTLTFKFRCPLMWCELQETESLNVRFCKVCDQHVTYCHTFDELHKLSAEGKCVAFYNSKEGELMGDVVMP